VLQLPCGLPWDGLARSWERQHVLGKSRLRFEADGPSMWKGGGVIIWKEFPPNFASTKSASGIIPKAHQQKALLLYCQF
jgi:hypothetical protein